MAESKVKLGPPRAPDYYVKAMSKTRNEKSQVGAAWKNPNGSISVKIDPFVILQGGADLLVTLFPARGLESGDE